MEWTGITSFFLIDRVATKYSLPADVVYGICMQESQLNPFAARYEPHYRWTVDVGSVKPAICSKWTELRLQMMSLGIMQVMGAVYRELGYEGWLTAVFADVETQLEYGCRHLAKKVRKYGMMEGILAYNAGSPRKNDESEYVNQYYYDCVMKYAEDYPAA